MNLNSPFYSAIECKILTLQFHDSGMSNLEAHWFPVQKVAILSLFLSHIMLYLALTYVVLIVTLREMNAL